MSSVACSAILGVLYCLISYALFLFTMIDLFCNSIGMIKQLLRRLLPKGEFVANVLTLMTGVVLAQLIRTLAMPVISRQCEPNDFGVLALFVSIIRVLSVFACWQYERAIVLSKESKQALALLALSLLTVSGMSFITFLVILLGEGNMATISSSAQISFWLNLVPIVLLFKGVRQAFYYWSIRRNMFKNIVGLQVSLSILTSATTIALIAITGRSIPGLICGYIVGITVSTAIFVIPVSKVGFAKLIRCVRKSDIRVAALKYRKFPLYSSWVALLGIISTQIPIWLLAYFFSPTVVGFYSLVLRLLNMPIVFLNQSVQQVYLRKASHLYTAKVPMKSSFTKNTLALLAIAIIPFLVFLLLGRLIFAFVFGAKWSVAGNYVQIMSPWLLLNLTNAPARVLYDIYGKQNILLIYQILLVLLSGSSMLVGHYLFENPESVLLFFSLTSVVLNVIIIVYGYRLVCLYEKCLVKVSEKGSSNGD